MQYPFVKTQNCIKNIKKRKEIIRIKMLKKRRFFEQFDHKIVVGCYKRNRWLCVWLLLTFSFCCFCKPKRWFIFIIFYYFYYFLLKREFFKIIFYYGIKVRGVKLGWWGRLDDLSFEFLLFFATIKMSMITELFCVCYDFMNVNSIYYYLFCFI